MHIDIFTDGGARGNPGASGCGFVGYSSDGSIVFEGSHPLGISTNNQAEYWGAIYGLKEGIGAGASSLTLHMDSELVVKQLRGEYKIKNPGMKELFGKIQEVVADYSGDLEIRHVPRSQNAYADKLSNDAMDQVTT